MRSRFRSSTLVAALVLLPASPSLCRTWHILPDGSGDAPTIQAGVDSAAVGDTVLVACGTHYEHDIILKGRVYLHGESSSTACAVIDAARQGPVLRCEGLPNRCYVRGLVLTGGLATHGGGLHCAYSYGPEIRDCVLTDNQADYGGAIFCEDCSPVLYACEISGNQAHRDGGGLHLGNDANARLSACHLTNNSAVDEGGAIRATGGASPDLADCLLRGNTARYGGVVAGYDFADPHLSGCILLENTANVGGVAYIHLALATFTSCTSHNNAAAFGSFLYGTQHAGVLIHQSIITFGGGGEAIVPGSTGPVTLHCTNIFGNEGGDWTGSISGQLGQEGNFSAWPRFCDAIGGNLHLAADSPCLPDNHPTGWDCGLIGALGQGCGPVALTSQTWARVKVRYR